MPRSPSRHSTSFWPSAVIDLLDERLAKLTSFNQFSIDEQRRIQLGLHCVQTNTYLPGEYSTRDKLREISEQREPK